MNQKYLAEHLLRIHKKYERDFRWKNLRNMVLDYVCGKEVLDVGCGTGHMAIELKKKGYNVTAVDKDERLVEFFKSLPESNHIQIKCMDIQNLKSLGKEKFDCVLCLDVLEHIKDDVEGLKNINYVLKKNGRVIVSVPANKFLYSHRDKELGHFRRYSRRELQKKLVIAGFEILKIRYWNLVGILPYAFSKMFKINLDSLRYSNGLIANVTTTLIDKWFSLIENNVEFPVGLTIIAIGQKN